MGPNGRRLGLGSTVLTVAFWVWVPGPAGREPAGPLSEEGILQETPCPPWSDPSAGVVPDTAPSPGLYRVMHGFAGRGYLGVGHLLPPDSAWIYGWQEGVRLPLYARPGGQPTRWISGGWVVEIAEGRPRIGPLQTAATVETAYEESSFLVLEVRDDGWLRVQVSPPPSFDPSETDYPSLTGDPGETAAWAHSCHLGRSPLPLRYQPWSELLLEREGPFFFRADVPHALRAGPGREHERLAWVPADRYEHLLHVLEVRGDWLRVRVRTPSDYCVGPDEVATREREGWVRWWSPELGPWVWYYTRGC